MPQSTETSNILPTVEADQFFAGPPGRGYLTLGRNAELVQLATPGS